MKTPSEVRVWNLGGLSFWELLRRTWRGYLDNQLQAKSAQFAFYSMLALVPMLILIIAVFALLPVDGMIASFDRLLQRSLPTDAYQVVDAQIRDVLAHSSTGLALGALSVFAFAGMHLFITVGEGLNAAFGIPARSRRIRAHGLSLLVLLVVITLLLIAMVLLVAGPNLMNWLLSAFDLPQFKTFLFHFIRWVIVTVCLLLCTSAIYSMIPAVKLPWHWLSPGNVFAVAGWMLASQGFRLYLSRFDVYNETYGTLGGVIVLLLWLHLTGAILMIGGQINGTIYQAAADS